MDWERELEQYKAIADVATEAFLTIDDQSTIRSANPAVEEIFGYDPDELIGELLTVLMPDRFVEQHYESLERYLATGDRRLDWEYIELPGLHRDGHEVPLAISFSEYQHEGDRFFTGIIRGQHRAEAAGGGTQRDHRRTGGGEPETRGVERAPRAVRLRGVPRPPGAAPDGLQLPPDA
jgi:PAS domain S-box-containing protein